MFQVVTFVRCDYNIGISCFCLLSSAMFLFKMRLDLCSIIFLMGLLSLGVLDCALTINFSSIIWESQMLRSSCWCTHTSRTQVLTELKPSCPDPLSCHHHVIPLTSMCYIWTAAEMESGLISFLNLNTLLQTLAFLSGPAPFWSGTV